MFPFKQHHLRLVQSRRYAALTLFTTLIACSLARADDKSASDPTGKISAPDASMSWNSEMSRPIHTSWGAEDFSDDFSQSPPQGVPLSVSPSYIKEAFGTSQVIILDRL